MTVELPHSSGKSGERKSVFEQLRAAILAGRFNPGEPLKAQHLASEYGVSLTVVREALARLNGESLTDRVHNRGFAVPALSFDRWRDTIEARLAFEPAALRLSISRGDFVWESKVLEAQRALSVAVPFSEESGDSFSLAWHEAHNVFHRTLLDGSRNAAILDITDRLWLTSALFRHWYRDSSHHQDFAAEHEALANAAVRRDADEACRLLIDHIRSSQQMLSEQMDP